MSTYLVVTTNPCATLLTLSLRHSRKVKSRINFEFRIVDILRIGGFPAQYLAALIIPLFYSIFDILPRASVGTIHATL